MQNQSQDIASGINSMAKRTPFSSEKIKKKWFNVKSQAKSRKNIAVLRNKQVAHEGVQTQFQNQQSFNLKISNIFGSICTEGIPDTNFCNTGDNQRENNASNSMIYIISANVCNAQPQFQSYTFLYCKHKAPIHLLAQAKIILCCQANVFELQQRNLNHKVKKC